MHVECSHDPGSDDIFTQMNNECVDRLHLQSHGGCVISISNHMASSPQNQMNFYLFLLDSFPPSTLFDR
eukprot:g80410.t1